MTKEETLTRFYELLTEQYNTIRKKYKQFCFLNKLTYSDDVLNDTVVKVADIINRKGLKKTDNKSIMGYFFMAFKQNTYQQHLQDQKQMKDENVELKDLNLIDEEYDETHLQYASNAFKQLYEEVKKNFDNISAAVWRIRYMVTLNGEEMNYKKIKEITGIQDTRRRIVAINKWIKQNITKQNLKEMIKNNNNNVY